MWDIYLFSFSLYKLNSDSSSEIFPTSKPQTFLTTQLPLFKIYVHLLLVRPARYPRRIRDDSLVPPVHFQRDQATDSWHLREPTFHRRRESKRERGGGEWRSRRLLRAGNKLSLPECLVPGLSLSLFLSLVAIVASGRNKRRGRIRSCVTSHPPLPGAALTKARVNAKNARSIRAPRTHKS